MMAEDGLSFSSSFSLSIMGASPSEAVRNAGRGTHCPPGKASNGLDAYLVPVNGPERKDDAAKLLRRLRALVGQQAHRLDQQDRAFAAADPHPLAGGDAGPARDPFAVAQLDPSA